MPKEVVWSPSSENDFAGIPEYLIENRDGKVANQFIDLTENILGQISVNPKQFPIIYKKGKIRKCVMTKHNSCSTGTVNLIFTFSEFLIRDKIQLP